MVVGWGSLLGVERIRHTFRWAMDRSITYRIWLIPLLNRFCHSSRGLPGLLLKGVSHPKPTYPLSAVQCQGCIYSGHKSKSDVLVVVFVVWVLVLGWLGCFT